MSKKIFFEQEARDRVLAGAGVLYRAVKTTMSPMGRNVVIKRPYGHTITHDGVTVAENIELDNLEWAVGADIIKEAAGKLNNEVGDGTTSVTVLTYNLMLKADELVRSGMNAMDVRRELSKAKDVLLDLLEERVVELTDEKLMDVAVISAGNPELGELIGKLALEVGKQGTIVVERGSGYKDEVSVSNGFSFERTYLSPYFVTDKRKMAAVLENPAIIITDQKLRTYSQVQALIDTVGESKTVFLICDELTGEALSTVVQSHTRGMLQIAAVQAPSFGDSRREILQDIAIATGGEVFTENTAGSVGHAATVIVGREITTIVGGEGELEMIDQRVLELETRTVDGDYEKQQIQSRIANIFGKVGTIKVGGSSESEADEKKYRVDDAVAAVKAAQQGGIVAGGGVTLVNLAVELDTIHTISPEVKQFVQHALKMPFVTILKNANLWDADKLNIVEGFNGTGINVMKPMGGFVDMIKAGVVDPAKVTRQVIDAAFSVAMTAITIDVLVVDLPDEV